MTINSFIVSLEFDDERLDKYINQVYETLSRSYIQTLIKDNYVKVNGIQITKVSFRIKFDDTVELTIPNPITLDIEPQDIPLDIVFEDEDIILINKPKNMVVHPSAGHYRDTLVNALMFHCKNNLSSMNGVLRPGIVHRIDKDTTGVIVACKNDYSHNFIAEQLKIHSINRIYNAIVYNNLLEDTGEINAPIGRHPQERKKMAINYKNGKNAITHYKVIERLSNRYTHIECKLETGRTHQIRVHLSSIKHPLLGDTIYGSQKNEFNLNGQTLHARILGFIHPRTHKYVEFEAPIPEYFEELLTKLR